MSAAILKIITLVILVTTARTAAMSTPKELPSIKVAFPEVNSTQDMVDIINSTARQSPNTQILLSSDSNEVLEKIVNSRNTNIALIPYDKTATTKSQKSFVDLLKNYKNTTVTSMKNDKIGFMIVSFNVLTDSYFWIHSGDLSTFEISGNVIFTLLTAIAFGINKDAWAHTTKPITKFFKRLTGMGDRQLPRNDIKDLSVRFFANLTLATAITSARIPFLPMDGLVDSTLHLNSWTLPFLISFISTLSSFAWSENIALIDADKKPISKFVFRRLHEFRSVILGSFAATSMLFSPAEFGPGPWITLIGAGGLGLYFYLQSDLIVNFLENHPVLKFYSNRLKQRVPIGQLCIAVYSQ